MSRKLCTRITRDNDVIRDNVANRGNHVNRDNNIVNRDNVNCDNNVNHDNNGTRNNEDIGLSEPFVMPSYQRRKNEKRITNATIKGTASIASSPNEHSGVVFRAARQKHSRRSELFIANVDNEVSTSDLEMYVKSKGFTVEELQCVSHNDAKNKSFRLRVSANEFPKLFEGELWPNGVIVRKFRNARSYNQQN